MSHLILTVWTQDFHPCRNGRRLPKKREHHPAVDSAVIAHHDESTQMSSESSAAAVRQRVTYRGRVQGVGFRAMVADIAGRRPVVGYVMNLPDGGVELVAQGALAAVEEFEAAIGRMFARNIRSAEVETLPAGDEFSEFSVRRF